MILSLLLAAGPLAGFALVHDAPSATTLATPDLPDAATTWCALLDRARR
ncbi:hypothetical protein [Sphingomonas bacterium]|nr:hypothetical protein [Sphingomonas bacterium]